jgi:hypothetical protein
MGINTLIKKVTLNTLLNEAPVTGDASARTVAQAGQVVGDVKKRMQKWGVYDIPELADIFTLGQLNIEPFKFDFLLQVSDSQKELTLPKPIPFETLARVSNENPFVLELKVMNSVTFTEKYKGEEHEITIPENTLFKIIINEKELVTNLPGTKKAIKAIKIKNFYNIKGNASLIESLTPKVGEGTSNKEHPENAHKFEVGQEITDANGTVHIIKNIFKNDEGVESIQIQKKGNKGSAGVHAMSTEKLSSWLKKKNENFRLADDLILEEDEEKTPAWKLEKSGADSILGKINVQSIELGPKAKIKRGEMMNRGGGSGGGKFDIKKWDGSVEKLPTTPVSVNIRIDFTTQGLNPDQQKVLNLIQNEIGSSNIQEKATIRKGLKTKNTFIVTWKSKSGKEVAFVGQTKPAINLKKGQNIVISPKARGNDELQDNTNAKIWIS